MLLRLRPATGHAAVTAAALNLAEIGEDIDAESCRMTQNDDGIYKKHSKKIKQLNVYMRNACTHIIC